MRMLAFVGMLLLSGVAQAAQPKDVVTTYVSIAEAAYSDALSAAKSLKQAVDDLIAKPTPITLEAAREAWIKARIPYQQTEVFRFGNKVVDDWEGKVNAWPLDEGLIDYVASSYGSASDDNPLYTANIIANKTLKVGGRTIEVPNITKEFLSKTLHEAGGVEANVATGYHAIEFLLWGQDLNGTGPGKGARPATDYDPNNCTGGHCTRRAEYLAAVTELLVDDLTWIVAQWQSDGAARKALTEMPSDQALISVFSGMGSLSYGELAGERMKLGLLLHDPEEEHDCFSDNTHASHFNNVLGISNIYLGSYMRTNGQVVSGPSVADLVKVKSSEADMRMRAALDASIAQFAALVKRAETGEAYDQMLAEGNAEGNAVIAAGIDALLVQTKELERAIAVLDLKGIEFQGSNSLKQ